MTTVSRRPSGIQTASPATMGRIPLAGSEIGGATPEVEGADRHAWSAANLSWPRGSVAQWRHRRLVLAGGREGGLTSHDFGPPAKPRKLLELPSATLSFSSLSTTWV